VFIVISCLGLLSCVELCIFCVICFCLLVRLPSGKTYSRDNLSFVSEGFSCKDHIEELFIVMYSQHVTLSTFSLLSLFKLQHTFQRQNIAYLC